MSTVYELKDRSDQALLAGARELVGREREATAQLIAHLSEIDERRLYLEEGCSSLFKYCIEVLHLSEPSAYNRIDVARVARKSPVIFEKLADGSIHLSAIRTLAPCLTPENHLALLEAAKHKKKEEVERIAVTIRPRPDVPSVIRKLPERGAFPNPPQDGTELFVGKDSHMRLGSTLAMPEKPSGAPATLTPIAQVLPRKPAVSALSPSRYKIEFTADEETHQAFLRLQELLRHQVPNGDPATIFKKALLLLLEAVRREKLGEVKHPRKKPAMKDLWQEDWEGSSRGNGNGHSSRENQEALPGARVRTRESRYIPANVKRTVWHRDKGQCTFVSQNGRRCTEKGRLEFHHVHAYALGGPATVDNIALRCRAHNAHEARVLFAANRPANNGANGAVSGVSNNGANGKKLTRSGARSGIGSS